MPTNIRHTLVSLLTSTALVCLTGCSLFIDAIEEGGGITTGTPSVDKTTDGSYSRFNHPETSPEDIKVYEYNPDGGKLPEGVYYGRDGQLVYEEAYPTPNAVVREAAKLDVNSPEDYGEDAIRQGLRNAAAEVRATHLVVNVKEGTGTAIFMPDAEPTPVERDPQYYLDRQAKQAAEFGNTIHVDTRRLSLDSPKPLRIDTEPGDCYALVMALDENAEFNWAARQQLRTEFDHPDDYIAEKLANNPSFESSSAGTKEVRSRRARGAWTSLGCVVKSGELVVRFYPDFYEASEDSDATEASLPTLGTGDLIIDIYKEPDRSPDEIKAERDQAEQEAERRHEEYLRDQCRKCVEDHRCRMRDPDAMCDTFRVCLERSGVDIAECRERNITP